MEFSLLATQLVYYIKQTFWVCWQKLTVEFGLALVITALTPHFMALHGLALIFMIDFGCGVWLAKRTRTLSSVGMRRGVAKLFIYLLFISSVALAEHAVLNTTICTTSAIGILCATEVLSIIENLVLLGLPIPYASKILSMMSGKAQNYGIKLDIDDPAAMANGRDVVTMLATTIPAIDDDALRQCMQDYAGCWYQWMRHLDPAAFSGSHDLSWARIRHGMDQVMIDVRTCLTKVSIDPKLQMLFLEIYASEHLKAFYAAAQTVTAAELDPAKKLDSVKDSLCLMLFRMIQVTVDRPKLTIPG